MHWERSAVNSTCRQLNLPAPPVFVSLITAKKGPMQGSAAFLPDWGLCDKSSILKGALISSKFPASLVLRSSLLLYHRWPWWQCDYVTQQTISSYLSWLDPWKLQDHLSQSSHRITREAWGKGLRQSCLDNMKSSLCHFYTSEMKWRPYRTLKCPSTLHTRISPTKWFTGCWKALKVCFTVW